MVDESVGNEGFSDVDFHIRWRFSQALAKSEPAVVFLCELLSAPHVSINIHDKAIDIFDRLLKKPWSEALALLARTHHEFDINNENDSSARTAVRSAVRSFVELIFPESIIAELRPKAFAQGVFMDLPASTITGAEIVEAKFQLQPVHFIETTTLHADGSARSGRPRGFFAIPMPPTVGSDTLDEFRPAFIDWLRDRFTHHGEDLTIEDIRERLKSVQESQNRRYYFVVNAPEWGFSIQASEMGWHKKYIDKLNGIIGELSDSIKEVAFFSLSMPTGREATDETTVLHSVFSLLHDDGEFR